MIWFLDTGGIYLGIVWVMVVAAKYVLPRKYPNLRREYTAPAWAPVIGALGAVAVIILALWPGTNMSLVWPGEYVVLLAWFIVGAIMFMVAKKMPRDEALTALLGRYKDTLEQGRLVDGADAGREAGRSEHRSSDDGFNDPTGLGGSERNGN